MAKDYQKWHKVKTGLDSQTQIPFYNEREVWWCSLGLNVGVEIDGKNQLFTRPAPILRKFNRHMFWGLPLTSQNKTGEIYHTFYLHGREETINFAQLRLFSSKRLIRRMGKISHGQQHSILRHLIDILETPNKIKRTPNGILGCLMAIMYPVYRLFKPKSS